MSKFRVVSIGAGIFFFLLATFLAGCGGGGGGGGEGGDSDTAEQTHTLAVQATVVFPASSPIDNSSASVLYNGDDSPLDSQDQADLEIITNEVKDAVIFLPARDGETFPTVYMMTTVVPGEAEVELSVEETAVSLVLTGVDHRYLADVTMASWVKSVVKNNSADFIDDLAQKLVDDPYLLRPDNMASVLGTLFSQAVADSDAALQVLYDLDEPLAAAAKTTDPDQTVSGATGTVSKYVGELPEGAVDFGDFFIKYDRTVPVRQFTFVPPDLLSRIGLWGSNRLSFVNGSMLPVVTRITDTDTNEVLKEIPDTFMGQAFSPEILSPTNGPFGLQLPNWEVLDTGTRNIQVEVFTPGFVDFYETSYTADGSPCYALLARATFSGVVMPLLGVVLPSMPSGYEDVFAEAIFTVLLRAEIFQKILYHFPRGEYSEGLEAVYNELTANWGLNTNIVSQIIEELVTRGLIKGEITTKFAAQLALKLAAAEVAIASAGISVATLGKGLVEVPSKVSYQLVYPAGLSDLTPRQMQKLTSGQSNDQAFTLTGHGLAGVRFNGEFHTAQLQLEAFDKEDVLIAQTTLEEEFDYQIAYDDTLDTITFKLPDAWTGIDTAIKYVRLTVHHCYVAPGWLGDYTSWTNYLEEVTLPFYESSVDKFTIYLTQELRITSVNPELMQQDGTIAITGLGFVAEGSGLENEVYFLDREKELVLTTVMSASETSISAYVPDGLILNDSTEPEKQHVGYSSVYVELPDGTQSNSVWVAVIPDPVTFDPEPVNSQMTYKGTRVTLSQPSGFSIYYTINGSAEREYSTPITILETSEIKAYAKVLVDGIFYNSKEITKRYVTCQEGETFIPYPHGAQCVVLQNRDLMPWRYCPLEKADYTAPVQTPFGYATCSYDWLIGGTDQLAMEYHRDGNMTTAYSITQFWAEPEGRPQYVWRPTASYHFCPDGSFGPVCGD